VGDETAYATQLSAARDALDAIQAILDAERERYEALRRERDEYVDIALRQRGESNREAKGFLQLTDRLKRERDEAREDARRQWEWRNGVTAAWRDIRGISGPGLAPHEQVIKALKEGAVASTLVEGLLKAGEALYWAACSDPRAGDRYERARRAAVDGWDAISLPLLGKSRETVPPAGESP
jgi:hypothetical protein